MSNVLIRIKYWLYLIAMEFIFCGKYIHSEEQVKMTAAEYVCL